MRLVAKLWTWYAHAAGILLIAVAASFAILQTFAHDGPVVEVLEGPDNVSSTVPYKGTLTYRLSTRRNASCPGTVISSFSYQGGGAPVSVTLSRPILPTEIRRSNDFTVHLQLPEHVHPGIWLYRSIVDSACPTYARQDVVAQFQFTVIDDVD
ncbi:hypothetical protein EOA88_00400 [Mesorhizobium sp. M5C.F.Ca.IN.020.14.1.1]|nr:hypothetical protein EOA88_00400 [Mesorhizobium sp. M5C.F.Ca.IN.020.14.1.1]